MPAPERTLRGKTLLITGASRGIGRAIALRAAGDGANVAILAKTTNEHPKLPGTIFEAAAAMDNAGGRGLPCRCDIRDDDQVQAAVDAAVQTFGGIDLVVNNASALALTGLLETPMKMYDRMFDVNARGSFLVTQRAMPHLLKAPNPHVLNISPPLSMKTRWFAGHAAYTMAKYAMSAWVLGMSEEFRERGVAFNALWPATAIDTAAVRNLLGGQKVVDASRRPDVVADAAWFLLTREARAATGGFYTDEQVLAEEGITDLQPYAVKPGTPLFPDFFLD